MHCYYATADVAEELDEMLKAYRYDGLAAGISCDEITRNDIVRMETHMIIVLIYI